MTLKIENINNKTYWCCPHCDAELMSDTFQFSLGKTIQVDISHLPILRNFEFSSSLHVGKCAECSKHFASIDMTFLHFLLEPVDCVTKHTNFAICQENLKNSDKYQNFKYFILKIGKYSIGTQYDIRLCILPLTSNAADDLDGVFSVSSCDDSDVWQQATNIFEEFLQSHQYLIPNILCHGIPENNKS